MESNDWTERLSMGDPGELAADAAHFARLAERKRLIERGRAATLSLTIYDFRWLDGEWHIDGMPADEWLDAMLTD